MFKTSPIDIAIIAAMDEEIHAITQRLSNVKKYQAFGTAYYEGLLHQKKTVVFQSGIGKVHAALAAAFVITHFSPRAIVNFGAAGGINNDMEIGDIAISSATFYRDVDVTPLGFAYGQIPNLPVLFAADARLISIAKQAISSQVAHKFTVGLIGTGDFFLSKPEDIVQVRKAFPEIIAIDMEAAAIGHTCYLCGVPYVIIRAISDIVGNDDIHVDFLQFLKQASINSANSVANMVAML